MAKNKVGRPSKIDKDTMKAANIVFIIVIIILLLLLSLTALSIVNPNMYEALMASVANLFK
jgi:hypothetical protein